MGLDAPPAGGAGGLPVLGRRPSGPGTDLLRAGGAGSLPRGARRVEPSQAPRTDPGVASPRCGPAPGRDAPRQRSAPDELAVKRDVLVKRLAQGEGLGAPPAGLL